MLIVIVLLVFNMNQQQIAKLHLPEKNMKNSNNYCVPIQINKEYSKKKKNEKSKNKVI